MFKRIVYTSVSIKAHKDDVDRILVQSARNNAVQGITGVLIQFDGQFLQVLEGEERDLDALLDRLRRDRRHRRMQVRFSEYVETRLFDAWSMVQPELSDEQIKLTLRLLTSDLPSSQEVGLTFLKYWLTTRAVEPGVEFDQSSLRVGDLESSLREGYQARNFSILLICASILTAVLIDAAFFISEYIDGVRRGVSMLQSYAVAIPGLIFAIYKANKGDPVRSILAFQITTFLTVSLHALWVGYGIYAPSLSYLGVAIASGVLSNRHDIGRYVGFSSLALLCVTVILSLSSTTAPLFSQPVAPHHAALVGLLTPVICILILYAHNRNRETTERFIAGVLADLTDTIHSLKKTMAARNYFFSAISHEIRTPMSGAISAVTLIQHPKANEEVKSRSVNALQKSLFSLNRLLNDLLDISKLESGKFELTPAPFDVNAVTHSVIEFFKPAIEAGGNSITVSLLPNAPWLYGDSLRFEQMLSNFLGNAVKFTSRGKISVSLRPMQMANSSAGNLWRCEVSDSGIGISPEDVKKLFQPFSQASQAGFSETKGTGLGLAIVAALASQMDGNVGVETAEGKGSTFWFTFCMPLYQHVSLQDKVA